MEEILEPTTYEKKLLRIISSLPVERTIQILDFARYIQEQTQEDFSFLEDDASLDEILADEKEWDEQFAHSEMAFSKMAEKVRGEIGKITPRMAGLHKGAILMSDDFDLHLPE